MDGPSLIDLHLAAAIDWIAQQIEDPSQSSLADRHRERRTRVEDFGAADHAVGRAEGHATHAAAAEVLLHFPGDLHPHALDLAIDFERVVNLGERVFRELGVECRADDLSDVADVGPVLLLLVGCCAHDFSRGHSARLTVYSRAAAPPMISLNSEVICV